jgi:hypothetical protein
MSRTQIIYYVVGACAVVGFVAWVGLILVPAWTAYSRLWQRFVAAILSLYVAAAMTGLGVALGLGVVPWAWDHLHS